MGNFDLYDHKISPFLLSILSSSPAPVLTMTPLASIAALLNISLFTFVDHNCVPLLISKAIIFPFISETITIPKPAAVPEASESNFTSQFLDPLIIKRKKKEKLKKQNSNLINTKKKY